MTEELDDLDPEISEEAPPRPRPATAPRELLEDLLPERLDWQELVRAYPWPAVALAALGGFFLARTKGDEIVQALSELAAERISEHVNQLLGDDLV
ncbi:MAG TPA: hypothetical protein VF017_00050 [Thermoanaerobaculia bacterium]|nr:hypothetical protein [Thermoanaerobaculia bacterium]